jgi:hypothetical protein
MGLIFSYIIQWNTVPNVNKVQPYLNCKICDKETSKYVVKEQFGNINYIYCSVYCYNNRNLN